jgi:hypothetical protein
MVELIRDLNNASTKEIIKLMQHVLNTEQQQLTAVGQGYLAALRDVLSLKENK